MAIYLYSFRRTEKSIYEIAFFFCMTLFCLVFWFCCLNYFLFLYLLIIICIFAVNKFQNIKKTWTIKLDFIPNLSSEGSNIKHEVAFMGFIYI